MAVVEWSVPAFDQLEALPTSVAYDIIQRVDLRDSFPELGVKLNGPPALARCRQLIVERKYRVIYEFDSALNTIWILAVQHCRQKLPRARALNRAKESLE
ncbi:MAG: type II toxin-antitoxin system RelE family toxin [Blastocatellia bacterium]